MVKLGGWIPTGSAVVEGMKAAGKTLCDGASKIAVDTGKVTGALLIAGVVAEIAPLALPGAMALSAASVTTGAETVFATVLPVFCQTELVTTSLKIISGLSLFFLRDLPHLRISHRFMEVGPRDVGIFVSTQLREVAQATTTVAGVCLLTGLASKLSLFSNLSSAGQEVCLKINGKVFFEKFGSALSPLTTAVTDTCPLMPGAVSNLSSLSEVSFKAGEICLTGNPNLVKAVQSAASSVTGESPESYWITGTISNLMSDTSKELSFGACQFCLPFHKGFSNAVQSVSSIITGLGDMFSQKMPLLSERLVSWF